MKINFDVSLQLLSQKLSTEQYRRRYGAGPFVCASQHMPFATCAQSKCGAAGVKRPLVFLAQMREANALWVGVKVSKKIHF